MLSLGCHRISSRLSLKRAQELLMRRQHNLKMLSNIDRDSVWKQTLKLQKFWVVRRLQHKTVGFASPHRAESRNIPKTPKSRQKLLRSSTNQGPGNDSGKRRLVIWWRRVQIDPQPNTPPCAQRFHERVQQLRSGRQAKVFWPLHNFSSSRKHRWHKSVHRYRPSNKKRLHTRNART